MHALPANKHFALAIHEGKACDAQTLTSRLVQGLYPLPLPLPLNLGSNHLTPVLGIRGQLIVSDSDSSCPWPPPLM